MQWYWQEVQCLMVEIAKNMRLLLAEHTEVLSWHNGSCRGDSPHLDGISLVQGLIPRSPHFQSCCLLPCKI